MNDRKTAVPDIAPRLRGLYARVARKLKLDTRYVTAVAFGDCKSEAVEQALEEELRLVLTGAHRDAPLILHVLESRESAARKATEFPRRKIPARAGR